MLRPRTTATECFVNKVLWRQKESVKPCTVAYSFHNLRSWDYLYKWNEQQEKPHAICIYQQPDVPKVAIGVRIHQWPWHNEGCTYDTTKGHSPLPCFWLVHLKFSQDFRLPKPKRSKRLSICLVTHTTHPQGDGGMSNDAKLVQTARKCKSCSRNVANKQTESVRRR